MTSAVDTEVISPASHAEWLARADEIAMDLLREVGDYTLNDRIPTPGWYS